MKRKFLSVLVSLLMIIATVYPALTVASAATWNGGRTTPELSGGVYQISTAEELAWFAYAVNSGTTSIKGLLISDIYLNNQGSHTNEWTPIGSESNPFKGTFDGNGFSIHGLYINSTGNYVGLFGKVVVDYTSSEDSGSGSDFVLQNTPINISNIKVDDSLIKGNQNVGGIVGYGYHVGISNCSYSGDIVATYNSIGGIIGWAYAESVVSMCHSTGSVKGAQRTGGIAGFSSSNSVITKCYSDTTVEGTVNAGGMVGTLSGSYAEGCFFLGNVSGNDNVGGVIGYSAFGNVKSAYAISGITSTGKSVGGAVGLIYGGNYSNLYYSYEKAGVDSPVGVGRTLAEMQTSAFVKELNSNSTFFCYDYTNINNGYPVLTWMLQTDVWLGELTKPATNTAGVYLISKPSELAWFAGLVNGTLSGVTANPAANANVISDLLLNISVYDDSLGRLQWTPIGTPDSPYTGTFNGGGYNIAGVYTTSTSGVDGRYVGLFGYVGTGSIKNTIVIDGLIAGIENVGGIAGFLSGGSVSNCCCNSEIQGDKAVGGIVGNLASTTSSVMTSCMLGTINGTNFSNDKSYLQNVGGIVGYNNRASVTKCFTYGKVNAPLARYVGGLVGNNSGGSITISYNASSVYGGSTVGGLVGSNNNGTVKNAYSIGKVSGTSLAGMAFGSTSGANVSNCYYDTLYSTISNTIIGATGLSSADMTGTTALTNMGFSSTDWRGIAQDQYYYYYPQINVLSASTVKAIKLASLSSIKRVQNRFMARVEMDGRTDTYYESINDALNYVAGLTTTTLPVIYVVRDMEISSTINITTNVGFFGDNGVVIKRAEGFTDPMFNITGNLTLGSDKYGDDNNTGLYINGNNVEGLSAGIVVANGASLTVDEGINISGFRTKSNGSNPVKGSAIRVDSGTLTVCGGIFEDNICKSAGGVIYNNQGNVTLSNGSFTSCEATQGSVIYNENGNATISGGEYKSNIASLNGGVASTTGIYGKTVVTGTAIFTSNASTVGGAFSVQNYATLEIDDGSITANTAYSSGGAIQVETGSEAILTAGTISDNVSNNSLGAAIYNNGTLTLKGAAQVDSSNDVYLVNGKTVTVADKLTCSGYAATITPQNYVEGTKVLDGDAMSMNYSKFGISNNNWRTLASGTMTSMETTTVAILSKNGAYSVEYISLQDAFNAVKAGETANITIVADNMISNVIDVNGDVTLSCDDNTFITSRSGSYYGVMFNVKADSVLRFGDSIVNPSQQAQSDYASGTDTAGMFVLDGGAERTGVTGAAAVNVMAGGKFYMYDDAVIQNCLNTTTSAVTVSGEMNMYGGTIRNNKSCYGGAIYVKSAGKLNTYGGIIVGNTSTNGGSAVYSLGTVTRYVNTYKFWYVETLYDESNNIIGTADPVYKISKQTDIIIPDDSTVYIDINTLVCGESISDIYVTSLSQLPESSTLTRNIMSLDSYSHAVGTLVVSGDNVIDNYMYFKSATEGYYIAYDGTLGINKLIAKADSGLKVNREKSLISGISLDGVTVGQLALLFENNKALVKYFDVNGTRLKNSNAVTTGCSIQLMDINGVTIDTLTLVVYGDVNCDFKIDGQDSVLVVAVAGGMLTTDNLIPAQIAAADVNFDGFVTSVDAEHTSMSGLFLQTIGQNG